MVALDQVRPPSGKQGAEKAQRVRDAKKGSGIVGPGPVELQSEPRALRSRGVRPVADRQGTDALLAIAPHVQERGSLRRAEPLVAVAREVRGADPAQIQRHHPRRVRSVDEGVDAPFLKTPDDLLDRKNDPGRAGHMIEQGQPGPGRDGTEHRIDDLRGPGDGPRHRRHHDFRAAPFLPAQRVPAGVVGVVGGEQLVARLELERADHGVHAAGRVRNEREIVRICPDEPRQISPGFVEQALEITCQELQRLPLHARAQLRLRLEHRLRAGSERAVVEEVDARVERPVLRERITHASARAGADRRRRPR